MIIVIGINTHEGNEMKTNNQTGSFNLELDAVLYPDAPDSFEDTESGKLILDQNELRLPSVYFSLGDLKTAQYERVDDMNVIKLTTSYNNDFYFSVNDANKIKSVRYAENICDAIQQFNQEPKRSNRDTQSKSRVQNADATDDDDSKADSKTHSKADKKSSDTTSKHLNPPYAKKVLGIIGSIILLSILVNLCSSVDDYDPNNAPLDPKSALKYHNSGDDYDPNNAPLDPKSALEYHNKYCNKNVALACNTVITLSKDNGQPYEACLAAKKSCALNDPTGCGILGIYYLFGKDCVDKDLDKAIKYLKMSCDNSNNHVSCKFVAVAIAGSISENRLNETSEKFDEMVQYLRKACAFGNEEACTELSKMSKI